jgi:hypothetical protein
VRGPPPLGQDIEEIFRTVLGFDGKESAAACQQDAI